MGVVKDDPINPKHYTRLNELGVSAIQVIPHWELGFELGNAVKYIQRAGHKPGETEINDLKKAVWYIRRRIHLLDPSEPDPVVDG